MRRGVAAAIPLAIRTRHGNQTNQANPAKEK